MLTEQERDRLLISWNDTFVEYPQEKCIHQLFEEQVERTTDAVAVVFEEQQLTYGQLNERANQLAHYLQGLGVGPEVLVGLCVERSLEMVVAMLGILKAGGAYVPLVPIQTSGELPPLFCVHPIGGNVLCYADLARHLGKNRPFYGLQSVGLYGMQEPLTKIEDMATTYIEALQTFQPMGPYYLGGWSMGGVVAWEIAQQLQAVGQEVALVALIDSYAPSNLSELETDEVSLANSLAADLSGLFGTELPLEQLNLEQLQPEDQLQHIFTAAKRLNILPPEVGMEQMRHLFEVFKANQIAIAHYQPQPYSGRVALFCASSSTEDRGWSSVTTRKLETFTIPGGYYTMMRTVRLTQPSLNVPLLAQELEACLNQV